VFRRDAPWTRRQDEYLSHDDHEENAMSDIDTSADRAWTLEAVQELVALAREGVSVPVISLKLQRSISAIHAKLAELGLTAPSGA
jgi:hypothetical protein